MLSAQQIKGWFGRRHKNGQPKELRAGAAPKNSKGDEDEFEVRYTKEKSSLHLSTRDVQSPVLNRYGT